jgi:TonB family protein
MKRIAITALLLMLLASSAVALAVISGPNLEDKAVKKVAPVYPPLAKRKRVQGRVMIGLQVSPDGTVTDMEFLEGNALFKPASMEAVKQWAFQKSQNGMNGHITFKFQLEEE